MTPQQKGEQTSVQPEDRTRRSYADGDRVPPFAGDRSSESRERVHDTEGGAAEQSLRYRPDDHQREHVRDQVKDAAMEKHSGQQAPPLALYHIGTVAGSPSQQCVRIETEYVWIVRRDNEEHDDVCCDERRRDDHARSSLRQRRPYGLVERARQLGWDDVQLVDDDLGRSGGGTARPGFEKLLAAICEGRVGAVVSLEASRLARNGRDWHTLLEFCGLVGTLIVDEEATYDLRSPNDRLLLGMKGTMSEMELSVFRQRSIEAMRQKARRGELHLTVAVGYVKTDDNRVEKDPDRRGQDGISLVFRKFAELPFDPSGPAVVRANARSSGRRRSTTRSITY